MKEHIAPSPALLKLLEYFEENRSLRETERQVTAFLLGFILGYYGLKDVRQHLEGKLRMETIDSLYHACFFNPRQKRLRALAVIFQIYGFPAALVASALDLYPRTVQRYIGRFNTCGLSGIFPSRKKCKKADDPDYSHQLFTLLHSPPIEHGFNRTTWRAPDLMVAMARAGTPLGKNQIGRIIRKAGYRFLKAREVLTSNDPDYRTKLCHIQDILSNLKETERFFSIDEFGPVAVKRQGGRRLVGFRL